jgi:type IV pilus biogenesis protein CpaD/CtpE
MAAAAFGAVVVIAVLFVPISYERAVGNDVGLTLSGERVEPELRAIAQDLKGRLGTGAVSVEAIQEDGPPQFVLRTSSDERSRAKVEGTALAFARELAAKGHSASVQVTPRREQVRYPVAAYAWDRIIQISVDGKSAPQLESEIRQRLSEAGVPDAQVSVTDHPGGGRDVNLKVERRHEGPAGSAPTEPMPELVLTKNGAPIAEGVGVKVRKKNLNGVVSLVVEVMQEGRTATAEIPNADSMSDADLASAISSRLAQGGINARVQVVNGEVKVEAVK